MSFYSADTLPRAISDLEGVLCAGGTMSFFGRGAAARLTLVLGTPPPPPEETDEAPDEEVPEEIPDEPPPPDPAPPPPPPRVWEEGIDELPDDDLPARDEGSPLHDEPAPPPQQPEPAPAVVVGDPALEWRAQALCCAFRGRGVPADVERLPDGRPVVRSAFRADLVPLAQGWHTPEGEKRLVAPLDLDGPRLRLWVLAAGRQSGRTYTLGLDPQAPSTYEPLLTACQRAGLGATLVEDPDEPVIRIVGQRRQRRLAELVGGRPRSLYDGVWPG